MPSVPGGALALAQLFAPRPGEDAGAYLDRVAPIVRNGAQPYRDRVEQARDAFERDGQLDRSQRELLQQEIDSAAEALVDRATTAYLTGELAGPVHASRVISLARELLAIIDDAYGRFRASLSDDQLAALDSGNFDFAELVLSRCFGMVT